MARHAFGGTHTERTQCKQVCFAKEGRGSKFGRLITMKNRRWIWVTLIVLAGLLAVGIIAYINGRPLPIPATERLYDGVTYRRTVRVSPRPMMIHIITIDMRTSGLRFLVTPPDEKGAEYPLKARTTTQYMQEFGVQIAINGDRFSPWWSNTPVDYYPHVGDPVRPRGDAASGGKMYAESDLGEPTLYISSRNKFSFEAPRRLFNAVSGDSMLVTGSHAIPDLNDTMTQPRSAIGYSRNGRYLYLVVVDGRQPFYSEGMTLREEAELMISIGAQYAMNLDGGGSSTLVVMDANGDPRILNSPIDLYIPGRERAVANHIGVFVGK